jgi:hypothetical protein
MLHLGDLAAEGLLQLINRSIVASHGPDQAGCRKPIGPLDVEDVSNQGPIKQPQCNRYTTTENLNGGGQNGLMKAGIAIASNQRSQLIVTLRRRLLCPPRLIL